MREKGNVKTISLNSLFIYIDKMQCLLSSVCIFAVVVNKVQRMKYQNNNIKRFKLNKKVTKEKHKSH